MRYNIRYDIGFTKSTWQPVQCLTDYNSTRCISRNECYELLCKFRNGRHITWNTWLEQSSPPSVHFETIHLTMSYNHWCAGSRSNGPAKVLYYSTPSTWGWVHRQNRHIIEFLDSIDLDRVHPLWRLQQLDSRYLYLYKHIYKNTPRQFRRRYFSSRNANAGRWHTNRSITIHAAKTHRLETEPLLIRGRSRIRNTASTKSQDYWNAKSTLAVSKSTVLVCSAAGCASHFKISRALAMRMAMETRWAILKVLLTSDQKQPETWCFPI